MEVSFTTAAEHMVDLKNDLKDLVGYSHASYGIVNAFDRAGIIPKIGSKKSPVCISMGFPTDYSFSTNQYKIGYTAWESTKLKEGWKDSMDRCDEIWATSSWTADVFRFLHIGEPQIRKNGQMVVDAFVELFGDDPNYQLILKCTNINTTRIYHDDGSIAGGPDSKYKNIIITTAPLTHVQMIELYYKTNVMIYPSTGEGFGFIPLQALATGMPTISTWEWAEYKKYITLPLESNQGPSEYTQLHPGDIYHVNYENLKNMMIESVNNYEKYVKESYKNSFKLHMEYDWDKVTEPTIKRIKNIFETRGF